MTPGQLRLYNDLRIEFISRCEHICYLLKDFKRYSMMTEFKLDMDNNQVDCWHSEGNGRGEYEEYYECFPSDLIYKSDEEILQWKDQMIEKRRKAQEEEEKAKRQKELDEKYKKFLELKRIFEK